MIQGRLFRVLFCLVVAMTIGSIILLALEGRPIKPMAYSLYSQVSKDSSQAILGTEVAIAYGHWQHIDISFQANLGRLTNSGLSGPFSSEFHFVISDGSFGSDGQIFASPRWTRQLPCLQSDNEGSFDDTIRICLITSNSITSGTPAQQQQLEALVSSLSRHCRLK